MEWTTRLKQVATGAAASKDNSLPQKPENRRAHTDLRSTLPDPSGERQPTVIETKKTVLAAENAVTQNKTGASELTSTPMPERIPGSLPAPTRALAERYLGPNGEWSTVRATMKDAIRALNSVEQVFAQNSALPAEVIIDNERTPVWDYIGQWVDAIGSGTIADIADNLQNMVDNPTISGIVARIVVLHAAQVFFANTIVREASNNPMAMREVDIRYARENDPRFVAQLEAISQFIQAHPEAGAMVKAFFNHNVPLLGNQNPMAQILRACNLK